MSWGQCSRCEGKGRLSWQRDGKEYDAECYDCRGGGGSLALFALGLLGMLVLGAVLIALFVWVCEGAPMP